METALQIAGTAFFALLAVIIFVWVISLFEAYFNHRRATSRQRAQRKIARIEARAARAPRHRA